MDVKKKNNFELICKMSDGNELVKEQKVYEFILKNDLQLDF